MVTRATYFQVLYGLAVSIILSISTILSFHFLLAPFCRGPHVHKENLMGMYETISIIMPNAGEEVIEQINEKTAKIITDTGGEILKVDNWGIKTLAYPIKKEPQGYYVYTVFSGNSDGVNEMERIFRIDDNVLKYMTIKLGKDFVLTDTVPDTETEDEESAVAEA